ncbi:MAG TPA: hypothetical protein VIZ69_00865, partial [Thermoanaerobaculia bacterium]
MKRSLSPILLMAGAVLLPASALSQTSSVTPAPVTAASPPTASQPGDASSLLDQLGGLVDRGRLDVEIGLQAGRVSAAPAWTVEVAG